MSTKNNTEENPFEELVNKLFINGKRNMVGLMIETDPIKGIKIKNTNEDNPWIALSMIQHEILNSIGKFDDYFKPTSKKGITEYENMKTYLAGAAMMMASLALHEDELLEKTKLN